MRAVNALERNEAIRNPAHVGYTPTANAVAALWETLCQDTSSAVCVLSTAGSLLFHNQAAARLIFGKPGLDAVGTPFSSYFEEPFAAERAKILSEVATTGHTIVIDGLLRGRMLRCTYRALPSSDSPAILLTAHAAPAHSQTQPPARRAAINHAGPLEELTEREFEILTLIGQGLSTADIAAQLGRSVKTIEWHRVSLGEKLGVTNRVQLAHIAIGAGLVSVNENASRPVNGKATPAKQAPESARS
jgi:DNA-binding CsgD family transcriptional regulator